MIQISPHTLLQKQATASIIKQIANEEFQNVVTYLSHCYPTHENINKTNMEQSKHIRKPKKIL